MSRWEGADERSSQVMRWEGLSNEVERAKVKSGRSDITACIYTRLFSVCKFS